MKFYLLTLSFLLVSICSFSQYYKDENYFVGASVGYQYPLGDFADQAKAGPSLRLIGQKMLNKKLSVGAELSYGLLGQDKFWDGSHLGNYDVDYNIGSAMLRASYYFDSHNKDFRPYISLAFGYFYYRQEVDFISSSSGYDNQKNTITQNKVGLAPNLGFLYHISQTWSFDLNLRFTYIPDFPDSVTKIDDQEREYQYYLGFNTISLPELSMGFYYRF